MTDDTDGISVTLIVLILVAQAIVARYALMEGD